MTQRRASPPDLSIPYIFVQLCTGLCLIDASLTRRRATRPGLSTPCHCVANCVFALELHRWVAKRGVMNDVNARGSNAALAQCQSDYAIGGVNRRQGGNGRSRSRREVEERSRERDAYFFFVVFFFFTVFFAFGAAAFAARFAFAMMITRIGLCKEIRVRTERREPQPRCYCLWLPAGKVAE